MYRSSSGVALSRSLSLCGGSRAQPRALHSICIAAPAAMPSRRGKGKGGKGKKRQARPQHGAGGEAGAVPEPASESSAAAAAAVPELEPEPEPELQRKSQAALLQAPGEQEPEAAEAVRAPSAVDAAALTEQLMRRVEALASLQASARRNELSGGASSVAAPAQTPIQMSASTAQTPAAPAELPQPMSRAQLQSMKPSILRKRAIAIGVAAEQLEQADDAEDLKAALVKLIIARQKSLQAATKPPTAADEARKFHIEAANFATSDQWPKASEAWEAASELDPSNGTYWYYRGIASQKLDRALDAEKFWRRGSKLGHVQAGELLSVMRTKRAQEVRFVPSKEF